jgi:hypothetical protein
MYWSSDAVTSEMGSSALLPAGAALWRDSRLRCPTDLGEFPAEAQGHGNLYRAVGDVVLIQQPQKWVEPLCGMRRAQRPIIRAYDYLLGRKYLSAS